jgi:hypothetical protein
MKAWQIALLVAVLVLGAAYVVKSTKPKVAPKTGAAPSTSNDLFASLVSLGVSAFNSKPQAPAAAPTYNPFVDTSSQAAYGLSHGVVEQEGNQLIDLNTGKPLEYGPGIY